MSFRAATTQTGGGTVTSYIPLTTAGPSISDCSSQIYIQLDGHLLAFDPYYKASISPNVVACFEPEITAWWNQQTQTTGTPTISALGPKFECPALYTPAATGLVNSVTTQLFCCPTGYTIGQQITGQGAIFPSQCASTITEGQILAYDYFTEVGSPWSRTTGTVSATTVNAMHVNGFVFGQTSSSSSTASSTSSSPTSSETKSSDKNSDGLSTGATAGIAIGAAAVVMAALIVWFLWYRRNKKRKRGIAVPMTEPMREEEDYGSGPQEFVPPPRELGNEERTHELNGVGVASADKVKREERVVHEMPGS